MSMISIHAPHTGRDVGYLKEYEQEDIFQSTRPIRGATPERCDHGYHPGISIHAPHTGRDIITGNGISVFGSISIHAPHTGRDQ